MFKTTLVIISVLLAIMAAIAQMWAINPLLIITFLWSSLLTNYASSFFNEDDL